MNESTKNIGNCVNCRYYESRIDTGYQSGYCHRYPPVSGKAEVEKDNFCGEFEKPPL